MNRLLVVLTVLSLTAAACGGSKTTNENTAETMEQTEPKPTAESMQHEGMAHKSMEMMCPMHIEGTTMSMDETKDGLVMSFSNKTTVTEVQSRVAMMVEHHLTMKAQENHQSMMPAFTLSAENTLTGARLMMVPKYATNLSKMREMMTKRHAAQGDSPCPMTMMMGDQTTKESEETPVKSEAPVKSGAHDHNHKH